MVVVMERTLNKSQHRQITPELKIFPSLLSVRIEPVTLRTRRVRRFAVWAILTPMYVYCSPAPKPTPQAQVLFVPQGVSLPLGNTPGVSYPLGNTQDVSCPLSITQDVSYPLGDTQAGDSAHW